MRIDDHCAGAGNTQNHSGNIIFFYLQTKKQIRKEGRNLTVTHTVESTIINEMKYGIAQAVSLQYDGMRL